MPTITCNVGTYSIVGAAALLAFTLPIDVGSYTITGTDATFGRTLSVDSGTYSLTGSTTTYDRISAFPTGYEITGTDATLTVSQRKVAAIPGSYTITGTISSKLELAKQYNIGVYTVTGTAATLSRSGTTLGISALSNAFVITGTAAGLQHVRLIDSGEYLLTGTASTLRKGKGLVALKGTYTLFGTAASLRFNKKITAVTGVYTITPVITGLVRNPSIAKFVFAESGVYSVSGQQIGRILSAIPGTYVVTGVRPGLPFPGKYNIIGTPVTFVTVPRLVVASGTYNITGIPAFLHKPTFDLSADSGVYTYFGFTKSLRAIRFVTAEEGIYTTSGKPADLKVTRIPVDPGVYTISGTPANLITNHSGRWVKQPTRPSSKKARPSPTSTWDLQTESPGV